MYCAGNAEEAEEGWIYFHNQLRAPQHHYSERNNPGYEGIHGYEEYLLRQNADVGTADASFAARRATQPIGTPDEIIERIRGLQWTMSLEKIVIHMLYGGMPRDKAEKTSGSSPKKSFRRCWVCPLQPIPSPWTKILCREAGHGGGMADLPHRGGGRAQVADFNAWHLNNPRERFWAACTKQLHRAHVTTFDRLWSWIPYLRPMLTITGDTVD